ncbi:MAG: hypothetical protein ABI175_23040, partial [Polyangiales bacterium]
EPLLGAAPTVAAAAQSFTESLQTTFSSVVLARVFGVIPLRRLPEAERAWAERFAVLAARPVPLDPATPVLTLLGTAGVLPAWTKRTASIGHLAIPLVDQQLVDGAPMIAELLSSLQVNVQKQAGGSAVELRRLAGGRDGRFYVADAQSSIDAKGRRIIAAGDFVAKHTIRTVFGMGGSYLGGELVAAIVFTNELLTALEVDRFPSLIGTFKIATAKLASAHSWI